MANDEPDLWGTCPWCGSKSGYEVAQRIHDSPNSDYFPDDDGGEIVVGKCRACERLSAAYFGLEIIRGSHGESAYEWYRLTSTPLARNGDEGFRAVIARIESEATAQHSHLVRYVRETLAACEARCFTLATFGIRRVLEYHLGMLGFSQYGLSSKIEAARKKHGETFAQAATELKEWGDAAAHDNVKPMTEPETRMGLELMRHYLELTFSPIGESQQLRELFGRTRPDRDAKRHNGHASD